MDLSPDPAPPSQVESAMELAAPVPTASAPAAHPHASVAADPHRSAVLADPDPYAAIAAAAQALNEARRALVLARRTAEEEAERRVAALEAERDAARAAVVAMQRERDGARAALNYTWEQGKAEMTLLQVERDLALANCTELRALVASDRTALTKGQAKLRSGRAALDPDRSALEADRAALAGTDQAAARGVRNSTSRSLHRAIRTLQTELEKQNDPDAVSACTAATTSSVWAPACSKRPSAADPHPDVDTVRSLLLLRRIVPPRARNRTRLRLGLCAAPEEKGALPTATVFSRAASSATRRLEHRDVRADLLRVFGCALRLRRGSVRVWLVCCVKKKRLWSSSAESSSLTGQLDRGDQEESTDGYSGVQRSFFGEICQ
ncbi:hypothetical protein B0H10DRAFT_1942055 [Mycena sp. CBHHK59/15]|nr:hypothetical protein B0H10DRAFT_1942055 [Mycena sp. CBHHK59/15]